MLYYVKGGPKEEAPPSSETEAPSKMFFEMMVKEWEHVLSNIESGKVVTSYAFQDRPGGFSVFEAESEAELHKLLEKLPLHEFVKYDIIPVITAPQALERAKKGLAATSS